MDIRNHYLLMADYNQRINDQVYAAASKLDSEQLKADRGAFFSSVIGTLNHILVGDLLWLSRFSLHSSRYQSLQGLSALPKPEMLDEILYPDLPLLEKARNFVDKTIHQWLIDEIREDDFSRSLVYANSKGVVSERDFGELLSHFFNHQTHHRGQVSTLLYQHEIDIGCTDFLIDIPDVIRD